MRATKEDELAALRRDLAKMQEILNRMKPTNQPFNPVEAMMSPGFWAGAVTAAPFWIFGAFIPNAYRT